MKVRGDFAANQRLILIAAISVFIGAICAFVAVLLLAMIRFFTNLVYFHQLSFLPRSPSGSPLVVCPIFCTSSIVSVAHHLGWL